MSIIKTTSKDWFSRKFCSAVLFSPSGEPCVLPHEGMVGLGYPSFNIDGKVRAFVLTGTPEKSSKKEIFIDPEYFDDMDKFKVPDLGWRTAADGRVLAHFSRNPRTYKKGVCVDALQCTFAPHTFELMHTGNISRDYYSRPAVKAHMVMSPTFIPLSEGLRRMNEGEIMSFAVSSNLAICPSADDDRYHVVSGTDVVGYITPEGRAVLQINQTLEDLE